MQAAVPVNCMSIGGGLTYRHHNSGFFLFCQSIDRVLCKGTPRPLPFAVAVVLTLGLGWGYAVV